MSIEIILGVLFIVPLLLILYNRESRPKQFPPGLWRFPVLGSAPLLKQPLHEHFMKLSERYGSIFSLYMANYPAIVLSDPRVIREAFKLDAFSGRPDSRVFFERGNGRKRGIIFNDGKDWQEHRRFSLKTLRDFGFGKGTMEGIISEEVSSFVEYLTKSVNEPIQIGKQFNLPVLNALWHLTAGERFSFEDQRFMNMMRQLFDDFSDAEPKGAIFFMPWLTKLAPGISGWDDFMKTLKPAIEFLYKPVAEHQKTFDSNNLRDLIDVYLKEIEATTDIRSAFHRSGADAEFSLVIVLLDLFAAGAETVSSTLNYAVLYLLNFPEIQRKLHTEIDKVTGGNRMPELSDRLKMNYVEAFISETLRYATFTPLGLFHSATETVEFEGYVIPKGTIIFPNLWQVNHSKDIWGDPERFRPERFLNRKGHYQGNENFMPFSVGKRVCIGEKLARDELFLFLTRILQKFALEPEVKDRPPPMHETHGGFTLKPKSYNTILRIRQ